LQQLLSLWQALDARKRVIAAISAVAMFAAVLGLARMASAPTMALLYSGLEPGSAGEVVRALEQRGVAYEIRGDAIFVEAAQRDSLRMTLAAEGLPALSNKGYELLDSLSGFGTTAQMFDAAYWRAKEGELARTILTSPAIRTARVHIAAPQARSFQRQPVPKASVTVTTTGGPLSAEHARALKYLVAAAVAGLDPAGVSVIDGRSGRVISGESETPAPDGGNEVAARLKQNVERLLAARVGPGRAVVEVAVETVTESESITERRFDPDSRVAISSETEERSSQASGADGGVATVASNLPDGAAGQGGGGSSSTNSETREVVNYEVSETTREVLRTPGAIRRLTVAVMVDGLEAMDPQTGEVTWQPRSEAELAALRDLVAAAVGLDESRGDTLTLKTLRFETLPQEGSPAKAGLIESLALDVTQLVKATVLGLVALILGLFVLRPIFLSPRPEGLPLVMPGVLPTPADDLAGAEASRPARRPDLQEQGAGAQATPALEGEIQDGMSPAPSGAAPQQALRELPGADDPVQRLREAISEKQEETVEILRGWLEEEERV
jgi:flagellar M-ring protein FliF